MLSGLEQIPVIPSENEMVPVSTSTPSTDFSLKKALQKSGVPEWEKTFKVITTMPSEEHLNLDRLPRGLDIRRAYTEIYYYVVARDFVENQPTFFHHLAGTVFYETQTQQQIYGKNHGQKAFATFKLVQNTIVEIEKALAGTVFPVNVPVLRQHKATLKFHYNALLAALKGLSDEMKEKIRNGQKVDIVQQQFLSISDEEASLAIFIHPQTPSPKKTKTQDKKTPKALTTPNKKSVGKLGKRLFDDSSAKREAPSAKTSRRKKASDPVRSDSQSPQSSFSSEDFALSNPAQTLLVRFDQLDLTSASTNNNGSDIQPVRPLPTLSPK